MQTLIVNNVWEEINLRLEKLKEMESFFSNHSVAIYGTGLNAERVINALSIDIVGLIDDKKTGTFIYGRKVLSCLEIELLNIDVIIIAAEPDSARIVYNRIAEFCCDKNITIFDMYGNNMLNLHREILIKDINYKHININTIKKYIDKYNVIFVSFLGCLVDKIKTDEEIIESVNEKLKTIGLDNSEYLMKRKLVQERIPKGDGRTIDDVYEVLDACMTGTYDMSVIKKIEKEEYANSLIAKELMLDFIRKAYESGKTVYILSSMYIGEDVIRKFLKNNNIGGSGLICADLATYTNKSIRYIRAAISNDGEGSVGFIGTYDDVMIPIHFQMDYLLLKTSENIYREYFAESDSQGTLTSKEREEISLEYNSPIVSISGASNMLKEVDLVEGGKIDYLVIYPPCDDKISEKLVFPKSEHPLVSIIIPTYNQFGYTYNCLKSVLSNTGAVKYEVIIADDCSTDLTSDISNYACNIKVLRNSSQVGFIKNCNNAAFSAQGRYIVFLNNDTQVQPGWLTSLLLVMEKDDNCGMAGSKLVYPDGTLQEAGGIIWNDASGWNYGNGKNPDAFDFNYVREVDYISGASIIIRKEIWDKIGGFDERYIPAYYEDADLAFEVRSAGYNVKYQPESIVVHFEGISNGKSLVNGIKRYQETNKEKFYLKWKNVLLREHYPSGQQVLAAADRKLAKKTVLFISEIVPEYDKDAGSRTLAFYIHEFLKRGYLVKFISKAKNAIEPYTVHFRRMGVEVVVGEYISEKKLEWITKNKTSIDYVFLNYPNCSYEYIDLLKALNIPTRYYGVDLHYLRHERKYEITGDERYKILSDEYKEKEDYIIKNSDVVYYPSKVEVDIVKEKFKFKNVKQLLINIYANDDIVNSYNACERSGVMFIGGYRHAPNVDAVLWFVNDIYPGIRQKTGAEFFIVGSNMPNEISSIKEEGVNVLGRLDDKSLDELYKKIKLVVIPLRYGAGIKGKVIEGMFHGVPVVSTSVGMEGIPSVKCCNMIADDEASFIDLVSKVYNNEKLLNDISLEETKIIKDNFSEDVVWENIASDF